MASKKEIKFIKEIHDLVIKYLINQNDELVKPEINQTELDFKLGDKTELREIREFIELYLSKSVKTDSSKFYNQLFSGFSPTGYLGEVLTTLTNSSMYTFEMSPLATLIEQELINKMTTLIGYENGFGTFVTGGSNGNLVAMLSARQKFSPLIKSKGLFKNDKLVAFVSSESHYSLIKAGYQLGIGTDQIKRVPCDKVGRMNHNALRNMINDSIFKGEKPFFVCATAGTTVRGAFDPLHNIADICDEFQIWFHVDGSWGGSVILSEKHKNLLNGSERSDSFTWCCHKMMGVPLICSVVLLKEKQMLQIINDVNETDYLFHGDDHQGMDLGIYSLQCGRKVDSLKLWLTWKYFGDGGYKIKIDHLFKLAKYAEKIVHKTSNLTMVSAVQSLNICFRIEPIEIDEIEWDMLTTKVRESLLIDGELMVNYATIKSKSCIRLVTVNFEQTYEDLDYFFQSLEKTINKVLKTSNYSK